MMPRESFGDWHHKNECEFGIILRDSHRWVLSLPSGNAIVKTEPRRQQILSLLEETGTINVDESAERFQVSLVTIRNDLDDLKKEGLLQRNFWRGSLFPSQPV